MTFYMSGFFLQQAPEKIFQKKEYFFTFSYYIGKKTIERSLA